MSADAKMPAVVALPWAHPAFDPDSDRATESERIAREAQALQVHADRLEVGEAPEAVAERAAGQRRRGDVLPPELRARGLPYEPWPSVPEEDREPLDLDALLTAAVALDVLTTRSKLIDGRPTILSELVETTVSVGVEGGLGEAGLHELIAIASGPVGMSRERLRETWSDPELQPEGEEILLPQSTPQTVANALRRLESGGAAVIREACLLLDALAETRYESI